jgi:predicted transcriptional regulator
MGEKAAKVFQVRLEPDLRELLESEADAEETTPSDIVRRALRAYLPAAAKQGSGSHYARPRPAGGYSAGR